MEIKKCTLEDTETLVYVNRQLIKEHLEVDTLDIEVLSWNEAGMNFWQSLGFCERSRYMRYQGEK